MTIDEAAQTVGRLLHIRFEQRDNTYYDVYYLYPPFPYRRDRESGGGQDTEPDHAVYFKEMIIRENFDYQDNEVWYPEFAAYKTLLEIYFPSDMDGGVFESLRQAGFELPKS